ncbi:MAG TPA: 5'/3'-nucleotidase SurE [Candidatus Acidoferrales bacterium]|nr:5'/3'-nucleotidase SurE [Candidatus Acidoferrales bacterium]
MHILLTNDDGIQSPALGALRERLLAFGRVSVIAPDRNQSATSQALTLHRPLRISPAGENAWSVDGTPADCVLVAFHGKLIEPPTFVVSGINHGPNMGEDVFYSGTVAAAIEGALQGVPAIAASLVTRAPTDFVAPAAVVGSLVRQICARGVPSRLLLNVNVPHRPLDELAGVRMTRLGTRVYEDTLVRKIDPRGREYFWIGGEDPIWEPSPGTDFHAVHEGFVSMTPLQLDLTDHAARAEMEHWSLTP